MEAKQIAREIFKDALEASLPKNFISKYVRYEKGVLYIQEDSYDLNKYKNIYLFGSGKAAFTMAEEIEKLLKERLHKGLIVAPKTEATLRFTQVEEGSHPLPSQKSLDAATKLLEMMQEMQEEDLFIYLLSGGSSALIELPMQGISLEDFQNATELMLKNGLEIQEMNCVRKHISQIKGGRLAQQTLAKGVVLVLSDIINDDLYAIGSAPLYGDTTTYAQAKQILQDKSIFHRMPLSIQRLIHEGIEGVVQETPKAQMPNIKHTLVASNALALNAAAQSAREHGLSVTIVDKPMQGDVKDMLPRLLQSARESDAQCILFGGECTVKVEGEGQGGRNQHIAALMLQEMCKRKLDITFLSAGTDGIDGNSDAAGAVVSKEDCAKIEHEALASYIKNFNSYNCFKELDSLIVTGASGTNVIDIAIIIKKES